MVVAVVVVVLVVVVLVVVVLVVVVLVVVVLMVVVLMVVILVVVVVLVVDLIGMAVVVLAAEVVWVAAVVVVVVVVMMAAAVASDISRKVLTTLKCKINQSKPINTKPACFYCGIKNHDFSVFKYKHYECKVCAKEGQLAAVCKSNVCVKNIYVTLNDIFKEFDWFKVNCNTRYLLLETIHVKINGIHIEV